MYLYQTLTIISKSTLWEVRDLQTDRHATDNVTTPHSHVALTTSVVTLLYIHLYSPSAW